MTSAVLIVFACLSGNCSESRMGLFNQSCDFATMTTAYLPQWVAQHPGYEIKRWTCVPSDRVETPT